MDTYKNINNPFAKYKATIMGLFMSLFCYLSYYTFVIPMFIMLPLPLTLEVFFSSIFGGQTYPKVGQSILITLFIIFLTVTILFFRVFILEIKKTKDFNPKKFLLFLAIQLFVVHPLVFYYDLSNNWEQARDGQFILSIPKTFQTSSLAFLIFGISLDTLNILLKSTAHNSSSER